MMTAKSTNTLKTLFALAVVMVVTGAALSESFTVTNTNDSGDGSLRHAIIEANANSESDFIQFSIPGDGPHIISPLSALPDIEESVVIDGYTQEGACPATAATSAILKIILDGSQAKDEAGLWIHGSDCTVRGIQIQGFTSAIGISGNNNSVEGNHILDSTYDGIFIDGDFNTIGGPTAAQRNVVAGNHNGIGASTQSSHNTIQGNYVGTDTEGQSDCTDGWDGVALGGSYNTVADNLISGYNHQGVLIGKWSTTDPVPEYNVVEGNRIGTNIDGTSLIPNGNGVLINSARYNTIAGNLIAMNEFHGILISNDLQTVPIGNQISTNSIFANGNIGIDLDTGEGPVTENDPGDVDTGPNNLMNFPVLTSAKATPGKLIVKGTIDTQDPRQVTLEFFANSTADATGYGEGEIFLGTATPNTKGKFTATLPTVSPGMWISATATDSAGNTSEFALCIEADGPGGKK
jgi:hypothetical protein